MEKTKLLCKDNTSIENSSGLANPVDALGSQEPQAAPAVKVPRWAVKKSKPLYFSTIQYPPVQKDYSHQISDGAKRVLSKVPTSEYAQIQHTANLPHKPLHVIDRGDPEAKARIKSAYKGYCGVYMWYHKSTGNCYVGGRKHQNRRPFEHYKGGKANRFVRDVIEA